MMTSKTDEERAVHVHHVESVVKGMVMRKVKQFQLSRERKLKNFEAI